MIPFSSLKVHRWKVFCLATIFFLSLLPVYEAVVYIGHDWKGFPPTYTDDDYYYARIREVIDGYPLLGNPYFYEHRDAIAPAFFFPDWVAAIPGLLGASFMAMLSIDFSLWSLVIGLLLFAFFRRRGLPDVWCTAAVLFSYTQVYMHTLRPVSMQLVYPVFLFFLLTLYAWSEYPRKKYNGILLALATALTFYDYSYLSQTVIVFLGIVFFNHLLRREWQRVVVLMRIGMLAILVTIPALFIMWQQLSDPSYWETMVRIGFIHTHIPTFESLLVCLRVASLASLVVLLWSWVPTFRASTTFKNVFQPFIFFGVALCIVSTSNIITGSELQTASHIERFVTLWLAMGTSLAAYQLFTHRDALWGITFLRKALIIIVGLFVCVANVRVANIQYMGDLAIFFHPQKERIESMREVQEYMPALQWLDSQDSDPKVVWADPDSLVARDISVFTKDYVLYVQSGTLHLMSTDEVRERYLVAISASNPTKDSIAKDVWTWAGTAYYTDFANAANRPTKACMRLYLSRIGIDCGTLVTPAELNADMYESMYTRYVSEIQPNIQAELQKFHVTYIMKDTKKDLTFHPERLKNTQQIYSDGRFVIYKLL